MMTVQKLISELKKMPQQALVVWQDHDQSDDEWNGFVGTVREAEPELLEALEYALRDRRVKKIVTLRG